MDFITILLLNVPFTPEDLARIEEKMQELAEARFASYTQSDVSVMKRFDFFEAWAKNIKSKLLKIFLKMKH